MTMCSCKLSYICMMKVTHSLSTIARPKPDFDDLIISTTSSSLPAAVGSSKKKCLIYETATNP